MKDLRIVIPAYNEEGSIGTVIEAVKKACPQAELLVVDDHSQDRTAVIASSNGVKLVTNPVNCGKGGAVKFGFKHDFSQDSPIKWFAFIDADSTYPAQRIPEMYNLGLTNNLDIVVGSRFLMGNNGMPKIRRIGNKLFAFLLSLYTGRRTTDTSTGLRVFKASLLPQIEALPSGLDFDTAMTTLALFTGLAYAEIPIEYHERIGKSKLSSLRDGYRFLRVIMNATRRYRPWYFFLTLGIPFLAVELLLKVSSTLKHKKRQGKWQPQSLS